MKPLDFAKAIAVALAVMVVNVLISVIVITIYAYAIAPGHEEAFYQEAAQRIAPWSSVVFGAPLFFGAVYSLARKRPDRNAIAFAVSCVAIYAVIDLSVLFAAGGVASLNPALQRTGAGPPLPEARPRPDIDSRVAAARAGSA